ncbi:MAG: ABC transporter permease [Bacteriovoracaceae bacterium]
MKTLIKYLEIYKQFVTTSTAQELSFRVNFCLIVLIDLVFMLTTFFTVDFLFDHVTQIGPWDRNQLLFYVAFMLTLDNIHTGMVTANFWMLSFNIKYGQMDYIFLKPVSTIFNSFFRYFRPSSVIGLFPSTGILIYYGIQCELTTLSWALIPLMLFLSLSLFVLIEFILASAMFWITEGNGVNFVRMSLQQIARWPEFVYSGIARKTLLVAIPILLIGSAPVSFLFDLKDYRLLLGMFAAMIVLSVILKFVWTKAMNQYESASS